MRTVRRSDRRTFGIGGDRQPFGVGLQISADNRRRIADTHRMREKPGPQDLIAGLEELHDIALQIDAHQNAFEELYERVPAGKDRSHRRDLNRLGCLLHATSGDVTELLAKFDAVFALVKRTRTEGRRR